VTATINTLPTAPTASGTVSTVCGSGSATIAATVGSGITIDWYASASGGTALQKGSSTLLTYKTPRLTATTTYYAQARNPTTGCVSSTLLPVTVTVNTLPAAPTAGLPASVCNSGMATISASTAAGTTVNWYSASSGGTLLASNSLTYTTPTITATTRYYAVAMNSTTGCTSSSRTAISAYVFTAVPATPGVITASSSTACLGTTATYSVPAVAGVDYNWTVPAIGATLESGQGTNTISVLYGAGAAGTLSVNATNACGISTAASSLVISTSGCAFAPVAASVFKIVPEGDAVISMDAKAWPSPTENIFNLVITGNRKEVAEIMVYDMLGRKLDHKRATTGEVVQFGAPYKNGMYIIEVLQGTERKILKVIKK